ncbi:alpha-hydroxy acid oxidase [Pollutimonas thiosulfatoxidans]|uniref:alpha-hydroxy acid oxidase n=1 Tax=Pollutimonas thiosulfatoxidans TaxID=2028345 RepID=UPI001D18E731|nr:alpha-hydroxy acid oxidase [Pollutimonas thiosulfatoxidans]
MKAYNNEDLRLAAKRALPRGLYEYIARGSEDETALGRNRRALDAIKFRPKVFVNVAGRNQKTTVLGKEQASPLIIAPTGAAGLMWYQGEIALARAAQQAGVPFTVSTSAITSMEKIAQASQARLWFQLYIWPDFAMAEELIGRAEAAGYDTLMVTVDTIVNPNREYNSRNSFNVPIRFNARNTLDVCRHPLWLIRVFLKYLLNSGMPQFENYPDAMRMSMTGNRSGKWVVTKKSETLNWDDLSRLRDRWKGSLVIKGILDVEDADEAARRGVDGIVVSNHGGRNLDCVRSPLEVLEDIANRVGDRVDVIADSGFTRGSDVVKALALGAKAVMVGRCPLYGLATGGEAGALESLNFYRDEIDRVLAFMGVNDIRKLERRHVHLDPMMFGLEAFK